MKAISVGIAIVAFMCLMLVAVSRIPERAILSSIALCLFAIYLRDLDNPK